MILLLVDGVIAFTLIEVALLVLWHRRSGLGVAPGEILWNLASGLCLMAALRCALAAAPTAGILAWLLAAGIAHGVDLRRRWRGPPLRTSARTDPP